METNVKKYFKIKNISNNELIKLKLESNTNLSAIRNLLKSENFISDEEYFFDLDDCFVLKVLEDEETIESIGFKDEIYIKKRNFFNKNLNQKDDRLGQLGKIILNYLS